VQEKNITVRKSVFALIHMSLIFLSSSCEQIQLPGLPTREPPGLIDTQAAQTIAVEKTLNAPTPTQTTRPTRALRTPTITNTQISVPTDTPEPTILPTARYSDDFSTNTGWAVDDQDDYAYGYTSGGYFISVNIPKAPIWSIKSIEVSNAIVETQASQLEGSPDGYYGVICRMQREGFNYYVFVISSDGAYGIGKVINGALTFIDGGEDQDGIIHTGNQSNRIVGDCNESILTLSVNDTQLLQVTDDKFATGTVGLVAGLQRGTNHEVLFEYFLVKDR